MLFHSEETVAGCYFLGFHDSWCLVIGMSAETPKGPVLA